MSILCEIGNAEKTSLMALNFGGKVLGLRACIYSLSDGNFSYYDFKLESIEDKYQRRLISRNLPKLKQCEVRRRQDGLLGTQEEFDGNLTIQEFKDATQVRECLAYVIRVLREQDIYKKASAL